VSYDYLVRFARLHTQSGNHWTALTRNKAPNKPLLLLTVLDLFAQGTIEVNFIEPTAELGELFASYWKVVMPVERKGNLAMPFFHLRKEGFFFFIAQPGKAEKLAACSTITWLGQLYELVLGVKLDETLFSQMQ